MRRFVSLLVFALVVLAVSPVRAGALTDRNPRVLHTSTDTVSCETLGLPDFPNTTGCIALLTWVVEAWRTSNGTELGLTLYITVEEGELTGAHWAGSITPQTEKGYRWSGNLTCRGDACGGSNLSYPARSGTTYLYNVGLYLYWENCASMYFPKTLSFTV